jgi:hypothetical protein
MSLSHPTRDQHEHADAGDDVADAIDLAGQWQGQDIAAVLPLASRAPTETGMKPPFAAHTSRPLIRRTIAA